MQKSTRAIYSVKEAAEILDVNPKSIYQAIKAGQIHAIKIGRLVLIPKPSFDRMLEEKAT
jgi:excisionase family DNA binding protein